MNKKMNKEIERFISRITDKGILKEGESLIIGLAGEDAGTEITTVLPNDEMANAALFTLMGGVLNCAASSIAEDAFPDDEKKCEEMRISTCKGICSFAITGEFNDAES